MSYHQDDGQKPVYHGHATSGCLMIILGAFLAILVAIITVFGVATANAIDRDGLQIILRNTPDQSGSGSW